MAKITFDSASVPDQPENVTDFPLGHMSWEAQGYESKEEYEEWKKTMAEENKKAWLEWVEEQHKKHNPEE